MHKKFIAMAICFDRSQNESCKPFFFTIDDDEVKDWERNAPKDLPSRNNKLRELANANWGNDWFEIDVHNYDADWSYRR